MRFIADIVKTYLVPGSITFLILGFVAGVALLYGTRRVQRWGRAWLTALAVLYWLLSTPLMSDWAVAGLTTSYGSAPVGEAAKARALVVLSNGVNAFRNGGLEVVDLGKSTAMNALEAARLYRLLGQPWVIASGGKVEEAHQQASEAETLRDALVKLGVPADRILVESQSRNTREQAENCAALVRARGLQPFVLVTAVDHMSRAIGAFRTAGVAPIPSAAAFAAEPPGPVSDRLRPKYDALMQSEWVVYEYLARIFYRVEQ